MSIEKEIIDKFFRSVRKEPQKAIEDLNTNPELSKIVWEGDENLIVGSTPLHWASHDGNLELIEKLIKCGADVNSDFADWWCRPIDWAADSGQAEVVKLLIDCGAILEGDKWSNCTPLHVVAQGGSTNGRERVESYRETAEILIDAGAEVNAVAKYGGMPTEMTPLDDALNVDNETVADVLKLHGGLEFNQLK